MSTLLSAKTICELALRKVGSYSVNDSAADGKELSIALTYLDIVLAQQAGSTRCWWLVPATFPMALAGGTASYDIMTTLGTNAPTDGVQFPVSASLKDSAGEEVPLAIVTREEWDEIADKDEEGNPSLVFIDRLGTPTLYTWPVLSSSLSGYTIELTVQTFAPAFHGTKGDLAHGLRQAWQLWAQNAVAAEIGSGPVRRLPPSEINDLRGAAKVQRTELEAYENRQHSNTSQRTAFRDF